MLKVQKEIKVVQVLKELKDHKGLKVVKVQKEIEVIQVLKELKDHKDL